MVIAAKKLGSTAAYMFERVPFEVFDSNFFRLISFDKTSVNILI